MFKLVLVVVMAGGLTACGGGVPLVADQVSPTMVVNDVQIPSVEATATQVPEASQTPTEVILPTATPSSTLPPIPTATPTMTPDYTATPGICDVGEFVTSIYQTTSVREGEQVHPGTKFTVAWRVKNVGHCVWVTEYELVVVEQAGLATWEESVTFPTFAVPGQEIDLSYPVTAPQSGSVSMRLMMRNAEGELFGVGDGADAPLTINFSVLNLPPNWHYDFAGARCQAEWRSFYADYLPCNGSAASWVDGYVYYDAAPALEGKTANNAPVLVTKANNQLEQFIQGRYPLYTVQQGDVFKAKIGCLDEMFGCSIKYFLSYEDADGVVHVIKEWFESYNGKRQDIAVDVSFLAGQDVRFILGVTQNDIDKRTRQSMGFWQKPRIENNE